MTKRVTIVLDDEMYLDLLDYSLERSKAKLRSYSASEAVRELLARQLETVGLAPPVQVGGPESVSA